MVSDGLVLGVGVGFDPELRVGGEVLPEGVPPRVLAAGVVVAGDLFGRSVNFRFQVDLRS